MQWPLMRLRCTHTLLTTIILLFVVCSTTADKNSAHKSQPGFFLDDSLSLQNAVTLISSRLCSVFHETDTASLALFNTILDRRAEAAAKNMANRKNSRAVLDSIKQIVYSEWKIGFDPSDTSIETLLPHLVLRNRKGSCLGVSLIMLMLAEKLSCPVYGVVLPGHFFCRYDDAAYRVNIEPNLQGCDHSDGYYRQRYPVDNMPWYTLDNLQPAATIGIVCYNAGTLCLNAKKYQSAIDILKESVRRLPDFPEAAGNLALAYAYEKKPDTALALFEKVFAAHPGLKNCAANYGAVLMAVQQYSRAKEIYRKGLEIFPDDTELLKGLKTTIDKR
jgi:tetratricopeptide (TPR) repeat protein